MTPKSRISVTLPPELVAAADRRAEELDRSRSWVVGEALRSYLGQSRTHVGEPPATYGLLARGLGPSRLAQLKADLALSPEERVREAEQTARAVPDHRRPHAAQRILSFDSYGAYLDWKRREDITL